MEEIFELIKAINRLKETLIDVSRKVATIFEVMVKSSNPVSGKYCDEPTACKILKVSERTFCKFEKTRKYHGSNNSGKYFIPHMI